MNADGALGLDVVVPVHNEELSLEAAVRELHRTLDSIIPVPWLITIADNASTDSTAHVAARLAEELSCVRVLRLEKKGRGHAVKIAWLLSEATVVAYMDADLSTDLRALPALIAPLLSGHSDVAIGTRLARSSRVVRGAKRELFSRGYNLLLRGAMGVSFSDAQCGFKALRRDVARAVLPYVYDTGWFFDTELLVIAERAGLRIHEVPVDWVDDELSSVDILATAVADIKGVMRIARSIAVGAIPIETIYSELGRKPLLRSRTPSFFGQVLRFFLVGGMSTIAFAVLYVGFASFLPAQAANFCALLLTAIANTAANRRFTFGVQGRAGMTRHHIQGLLVFALSWAMSAGALLLLHAAWIQPSPTVEVLVLTVANLLATVLRFALFRRWVFRLPLTTDAATTSRASVVAAVAAGSQR
ncbi:bifunctional glycosyltransferase family 2/GtrA family protein [Microbacterium trichothecenolyticum]|uniref:dolichyl-phosphate beta-glucosyltransferase n=1 Tax=Microbacterium trichothecenolyticum TaxID=69370 RepID=A0A0M2HHJ6_MICTR|nr:bifunctional glycosyltransferase family 2/GtrA family protein [Microbacterium trichothecenolyticum]KJL43785.1 Undecaprenyl-phosphate mannosyltransferase [Microbacterium trichothecenolyticum]